MSLSRRTACCFVALILTSVNSPPCVTASPPANSSSAATVHPLLPDAGRSWWQWWWPAPRTSSVTMRNGGGTMDGSSSSRGRNAGSGSGSQTLTNITAYQQVPGGVKQAAKPPVLSKFKRWNAHGKRWLLPILLYGPNNQITGLKESLVLSRLLRRVAVLPNIHEHASQIRGDDRPLTYPYDEIFDPNGLKGFLRETVLEKKLLASGWDGQLDALLYWNEADYKYLDRVKEVDGIRLRSGAPRLLMDGPRVCNTDYAYSLKNKIKEHRVIGVLLYNRIIEEARHHSLHSKRSRTKEESKCYDTYRLATKHMPKAQYIRDIAKEFIRTHLGGQAYGAVHVRPYPDVCMTLWRDGFPTWETSVRKCRNPTLHKLIGVQTVAALQLAEVNNTLVFAASHPHARKVIDVALRKEGLTPVYLSPQYVLDALVQQGKASNDTSLSTTVLMFVEQEIALQSKIFVGTLDSSITGMIRQERTAWGTRSTHNLVFNK